MNENITMVNDMATVPYAVYKLEKDHQKKLNIIFLTIILVLTAALITAVTYIFVQRDEYEKVVEETIIEEYEYEVEQSAENGDNNFIGHDGEINYGEAED